MPVAAAISEHPLTAVATGEVAGAVLEQVGERPDLALVFVTAPHAGALEDVVAAVDEVLHPLAMLATAAESVVGPHREVEQDAAVSLFAGSVGPLVGMTLHAAGADADAPVRGWPERVPFAPSALLLLADPFSFPIEEALDWIAERHPGLPVVGGMASAGRGPGGNHLAHGRAVQRDGAVGALLGPGVQVDAVVSQGCRPFGRPLTVTRAESNVLFELAGKPALERLVAQAQSELSAAEVAVVEQGGLHIGRVIDEHRPVFGPGDFLVRNVLGADRRTGAVAVGDVIPVGATVQFHLRDADSADADLRALLDGRRADGALLFTCTGRGSRMFDGADHDASVMAQALHDAPVAGCFAAGELGPIGGRNFVHGFTASMALLSAPSAGPLPGPLGDPPTPG